MVNDALALLRAEKSNKRPEFKTDWRCGGSKIIMATTEEQESYGELDIACPGCPDCKEPEASEFTKECRKSISWSPIMSNSSCKGYATRLSKSCDIIDRLAAELKELSDTVQINCNPPKDCNDPVVLKTYMKACFDKAMEYPK